MMIMMPNAVAKQLFLLFASIHVLIADQFNIKDSEQPDIVLKNGATNAITLDCLYDIDENQSDDLSGFTVKWFYQNDVEPIYQWIPDQKSISVRGPFEKFIVVNYSVSDEPYHSYRALRLNDLQTNMSGIYKCVVSTFTKEEYQYQKLVIYEPEKSFDIIKINEGPNITIICSASVLFPEPKITILISRDSEETVFDNIENVISQDEYGFFNITAIALYREKIDQPVDFKCLLEIEEADYKALRDLHYYPDHALSHLPSICLIVASLALLVFS